MHMRSTHSADTGANAVTGSTKKHVISRLHKATVSAGRLIDLLQDKQASKANSGVIFEARAYYVSLFGAIAFERKHWKNCIHYYSEARLIYTALGTSQNSRGDVLFRDLLSSTIDSSIRYAAYQLKIPRTTSIESIVAQNVPRGKNDYVEEIFQLYPEALNGQTASNKKSHNNDLEDVPTTVQWRSRIVKLEDAATAQALAAVSSAEKKLSSFLSLSPDAPPRAKAAAYDGVLIPSQDAADATRTAIEELTADGVSQSDPRMQSLQMTRTAVNYALIGWRTGRNRVLCGEQDGATLAPLRPKKLPKFSQARKVSEPQTVPEESHNHQLKRLRERLVLYDATLQSLDSVHLLPGVAADQSFQQEVEAKRSYFVALRCLAIARSHSLLGNTKNALGLLTRALEHCSNASRSTAFSKDVLPDKPPDLTIAATQLTNLQHLIHSLLSQHRALVELHNLSGSAFQSSSAITSPLIEILDRCPQGAIDLTNLVTYPPKVKSIAVKPLFLDLAYNYIEYPGRTKNSVEEPAIVNGVTESIDKKEAKKGWFGFGR
ncbi:MAG: hypothetical protein Q9164_003691 [Protoblastenia rupestris]